MSMFKNITNDIPGRLALNKLWWSSAREGEPLAKHEIDEAKWLTEMASKQVQYAEIIEQQGQEMIRLRNFANMQLNELQEAQRTIARLQSELQYYASISHYVHDGVLCKEAILDAGGLLTNTFLKSREEES